MRTTTIATAIHRRTAIEIAIEIEIVIEIVDAYARPAWLACRSRSRPALAGRLTWRRRDLRVCRRRHWARRRQLTSPSAEECTPTGRARGEHRHSCTPSAA